MCEHWLACKPIRNQAVLDVGGDECSFTIQLLSKILSSIINVEELQFRDKENNSNLIIKHSILIDLLHWFRDSKQIAKYFRD